MKQMWAITLLAGVGVGLLLEPCPVFSQTCKDDVDMVDGSKQALADFIGTVKRESLPDFERMNHQKSAVIKLSLHDNMLGELVSCLDKAAKDSAAPKQDAEAARTQHDAAANLLEKLQKEQGAIKEAHASKDAKALVEKLDLGP